MDSRLGNTPRVKQTMSSHASLHQGKQLSPGIPKWNHLAFITSCRHALFDYMCSMLVSDCSKPASLTCRQDTPKNLHIKASAKSSINSNYTAIHFSSSTDLLDAPSLKLLQWHLIKGVTFRNGCLVPVTVIAKQPCLTPAWRSPPDTILWRSLPPSRVAFTSSSETALGMVGCVIGLSLFDANSHPFGRVARCLEKFQLRCNGF